MGHQTHGTLHVYEEGTRIDIQCPYTPGRKQIGGGRRSKISSFSRASRLRLIKLLSSLRQESVINSKLITLTYHEKYEHIKRDLKHFKQFLHRFDSNCSGIWRLEYQKRGTPHFHLLHFGRYIPHADIGAAWNRIADPTNVFHGKAGTEIRSCRDVNAVGPYLCKYLGKLEDHRAIHDADGTYESMGRLWGVYRRSGLPVSNIKVLHVPWSQASQAIETELSKYTEFTTARSTCSIFTHSPTETTETTKQLTQ
ncbi:MAG: hypothetical protein GY941_18780 [Planctomycetes bacterium]|nr:hypothetical protein [Planctomycetota bacterium]